MNNNDFTNRHIPEELPLLSLKDAVLFPFMIMPVFVTRNFSIEAVNKAISDDRLIIVSTQKKSDSNEISMENIYPTACVATILKMQKLFDGRIKLLVQGIKKTTISAIENKNYYYAKHKVVEETLPDPKDNLEISVLIQNIKSGIQTLSKLGEFSLPPDISAVFDEITDPNRFSEMMISHIPSTIEQMQQILELNDAKAKLELVNEIIAKELSLVQLQNKIKNKTKEKLGKAQKDYFLKEQLKQIQKELGQEDPHSAEINEYEEKLKQKKLPKEVAKEVEKQLTRLKSMNPASSETTVIKNYIDTILEIPWSEQSKDNKDINKAKKILEKDHYGLFDIKERILEFLAVRQVKGNTKSPILCFIGPPGVGKTSLGKSIARSMNRKFYRLSLGGLHDEAEIRGHRRTYVGAMPGKIIEGLKSCGTINPVFMLDEIDKVGKDFRGDPSSALLEVLDPEQNFAFRDNYLGMPYDLSKVFFIATANWEETIPGPLKDRMEVIRLSGYTDIEKLQIAKQYIIPRQMENNGLEKNEIVFTKEAILFLIRRYTRESGVRNLEQKIGAVCRKTITLKVSKKSYFKRITPKIVEKYLKEPPFSEDFIDKNPKRGVVTGLAWTMFGGTTLKIESNTMDGKGQLILTGKLGDVMKESARIALSYIKSNAKTFKLDKKSYENKDLHIHVPAGAVPKDGPSAGITITTSLLSLFLNKTVDSSLAMTGEISLTGEVLPIGGLKEKLLAAKRYGIKKVLVPKKNSSNYQNLDDEVKSGLKVVFVSDYLEVFKEVFGNVE